MLKLLLGHWQTHREPLPFVLTDDPLYCSHLTKSPFPEVYSVNRVNPIFEDEEDETKSTLSSNCLKRSLSEERRENETRASDDTGYSSCSHPKSLTTAGSLTDDVASLEARRMSSDSDECSQPEAVVVSADVHRVSYPEDVIVLSTSSSSNGSQTFSVNSYFGGSSDSSQDPFDSLTMSSTVTENNVAADLKPKAEVKKPSAAVRERLQKLLEKGNERSEETFLDSLEAKPPTEQDIEKTKNELMKSLTRALNNKTPNRGNSSPKSNDSITRTDSALDAIEKSLDRKSTSNSTSPKTLSFPNKSTSTGVTRQDESSGSSSSTYVKPRKYLPRAAKNKEKRESLASTQDSSDSKKSHKCKLCENVHRPLAFHQLLPGHWSYDNVYLPQIHRGMCCSCVHRHSFPHASDDDVFYPLYYPSDLTRARHSWAPYPNSQVHLEKHLKPPDEKSVSTSTKESSDNKGSPRYSPDGSSRETESSDTGQLKKSLCERRSLREPKKCKCDNCLESALDKDKAHLADHTCPCCYVPHRRVKFASDTDLSQHKHIHSPPLRIAKDVDKLINGEPINAAFVMNLPHLNGHVLNGGQATKENGSKTNKKVPPLVPRGLKEPIKMDELYRTYPINFREWESHYRRSYLQKRRKRALNMVGMAIGIILVVGIAVSLAFVFLRIKRPA